MATEFGLIGWLKWRRMKCSDSLEVHLSIYIQSNICRKILTELLKTNGGTGGNVLANPDSGTRANSAENEAREDKVLEEKPWCWL